MKGPWSDPISTPVMSLSSTTEKPFEDDIPPSPIHPDEEKSSLLSHKVVARLSIGVACVCTVVIIIMVALELALLALASSTLAQNTLTSTVDVYAAQATAVSSSPVSKIPGVAFDRIAIIWLENTDYAKASGDPNMAWLASQGQTLTNFYGVTHPSEPNYVSSIGGDYFGMDNDAFSQVTSNVSTVIDLLEARGISWGQYQEDMPYAGYEGMQWRNTKTQANDYVRKHNPAVIFNSVTNSPKRLSQIKNLTNFYTDLNANTLPQWMFITPNMTSDGHDSSVTTAGAWTRNFVEPLLTNPKFMSRTLVLITFDENHTYSQKNNVMGILLGDALPKSLINTTDTNFYNHYSEIATVEANWHLNTLGRFDVGANVFSWVAKLTGDVLRSWNDVTSSTPTRFLNASYAGVFNSDVNQVPYPIPNLLAVTNGRTVLPSIAATYAEAFARAGFNSIYQNTVQVPDCMAPPQGYSGTDCS